MKGRRTLSVRDQLTPYHPSPESSGVRAQIAELLVVPRNRVDEEEGNAMNSRSLIHHLVATQLRIDERSIHDTDSFAELGLSPLDLVLIVLRLEDFDRGDGSFPLAALEGARTVGDLVTLVDVWVQDDQATSRMETPEHRRSSVA
jgi:acyl carrier protein